MKLTVVLEFKSERTCFGVWCCYFDIHCDIQQEQEFITQLNSYQRTSCFTNAINGESYSLLNFCKLIHTIHVCYLISFAILKALQAPVLTRQFDAAITVLLQNYTVGAIHFL